MSRRTERINAQLREEISDLLLRDVKDPRVTGLVTVTHVEVSPDLAHARVHVSFLGEEGEQDTVLAALRSAAPFLRHELLRRLRVRTVPSLTFKRDDSIQRAAELTEMIHGVTRAGEP